MNYQLAIDIASKIIKKEEGYATKLRDGRVQAYWDSKGQTWTIGYGNTYYENGRPVKEGDIITYSQAVQLMKAIVAQKEKAIRPLVTARINENQYAALISLAYNCGEGNLKKSTLLDLINNGAPIAQIEAQFVKTCVTAKGQYVVVLYKRRQNELELFMFEAARVITSNPEVTIATGLTLVALTAYTIYRYAKSKAA